MNKLVEEEIIKDIGENRFQHVLRVKDMAVKLAKINGVDIKTAETAALFHDCGKISDKSILLARAHEYSLELDQYMEANHELIHAELGSKIAELNYGIEDKDILNAIKYHTTGRANMTMLEKIIYMADYIEPERKFQGVEATRDMAFKNIDKALFKALNDTIIFLIEKNWIIHIETIRARNYLILK